EDDSPPSLSSRVAFILADLSRSPNPFITQIYLFHNWLADSMSKGRRDNSVDKVLEIYQSQQESSNTLDALNSASQIAMQCLLIMDSSEVDKIKSLPPVAPLAPTKHTSIACIALRYFMTFLPPTDGFDNDQSWEVTMASIKDLL